MIRISDSVDEIGLLKETFEVECKLAAGSHGRGQLPKDLWPTYSAFANSYGGIILLGVKERAGSFEIIGIDLPDKLRADFFNQLNNPQKVSVNLLSDRDVGVQSVDGKTVIVIDVPRANRKQRPVHINGNPMTGTYRRLNDGDRLCSADEVRRMLSEQIDDTRDNRILKGYDLSDLSMPSLQAYRRMLRDKTPEHPYLDHDDREFLRMVGGWRIDRETGETGITVAGLLMFGRFETIRDEFPDYFLDYQERPEARREKRWVDRITLDGTWSGNVFDFYVRVYRKLAADFKIPFAVEGGQRKEDTPVHIAVREALVNTLVHADYTGRSSILVVKRPDMFGFRNPGLMRIPVSQAIAGGESDGRNRTLQQMFLLIGAGERAGSGVPKILKGWTDQHWVPPALYEREEPSEQTLLELRMVDLLPLAAVASLRDRFGEGFDGLSPEERVILATAFEEQTITHARVSTICDKHPTDLTRLLQGLVHNDFLVQNGRGRGAVYHLPGVSLPSPETVFGSEPRSERTELSANGTELQTKAADLSSEPSLETGGRMVEGLVHPIFNSVDEIYEIVRDELNKILSPIRKTAKIPQNKMRDTIIILCRNRYLTIKVLSSLLGRDDDYLRTRHLNPMVEEGRLFRAFPQTPNDPRQAYTSSPSKQERDVN